MLPAVWPWLGVVLAVGVAVLSSLADFPAGPSEEPPAPGSAPLPAVCEQLRVRDRGLGLDAPCSGQWPHGGRGPPSGASAKPIEFLTEKAQNRVRLHG